MSGSGGGIWLVKLKDKPYGKTFGDAALSDDDKLSLTELNDGHTEIHTVREFLDFATLHFTYGM